MSDQQSPQAVECLPEKWQALCEAAPGWRSLYDKGLMMNEAAITSAGDAFSDAQATIDALRVELAIARGVMQNAMQCSNDLLAELATLKARALDVDAVMALLAEMVAMMDSGDEHGAGCDWHTRATALLAKLKERQS